MLPFEPEPIDVLRLRYPLAMKTVFDVDAMLHGRILRPGEIRAHIFDFEDGLRLIISRERLGGGPTYLHLSASPTEGSELRHLIGVGVVDIGRFREIAERAFRDVSGDDRPLHYLGRTSPMGIPHWVHQEREVAVA